ncbi:MAG: sensor histidine kinase [Ilumatobacteraceae bacterium]
MAFFRRERKSESSDVTGVDQTPQLSLEQMRLAMNALPMGVVIVSKDGQSRWTNSAVEDLLAQGSVDVERFNKHVDALAAVALGGESREEHVEFGDPAVRMFEMVSAPLTDGGGAVIVYDETKQVMTDRVRTDFVANISHELRTPIGAVSLMAENLMAATEDTDVARMASVIFTEVTRLNDTVGDLLELARIEFDGLANTQEVDLVKVVEEATGRLRSAALAKSVMISIENYPQVMIVADRAQLVSAISNLLDNAIKFSPNGSIVKISIEVLDDQVKIVVSDNGPGIRGEHLKRIFERFYRVDDARSRSTGGTGLGLAIVRHIALLHGGDVSAESTLGEGSRFTLTLPLRQVGNMGESED